MKWQCAGWKYSSALAVFLAAALVVSPVAADDGDGVGGMDAQTFRPAIGPGGQVITVEGADTADELQPYGGVFFDYFTDPVVLEFDDDTAEPVVDHQFGVHAIVGVGVADWVAVELAFPVMLGSQGSYDGFQFDGNAPGDVSLRSKATIMSSDDDVVGLGASLDISAPTGDPTMFRGARTPSIAPALIADTRMETPAGEVLVAANTGFRLQGSEEVHDTTVGSVATYGAGVELAVIPEVFSVGTEVAGKVGLSDPSRQKNPLEWLAGIDVGVTSGLTISAGGGAGLVSGVGSPRWRGFGGITYAPMPSREEVDPTEAPPAPPPTFDDDEPEAEVDCPPEPDDFAGPYDDDGCAITPETFMGCDDLDDNWEGRVDEWGCPLLDSDGDGFLVEDDACPMEPVVFIDGGLDDGCPDYDVDGDGISNVDDHCPLTPGIEAYDGCPPDEDEELVERTDEEIEIDERVHFEVDKAVIKEESFDLLDEVAMVLRTHTDILSVEIAGHTDAQGDDDYNMMLSEERARAVRQYLVEKSDINADRLDATGYGMTEPVIDEDTDEARAKNRRVEFRIVEIDESQQAAELE